MPWELEAHKDVALIRMNTNNVNRQNDRFFGDLDETLDRLERDYPRMPVVLTSAREVFSAGFDFDYWFPRIHAGDLAGVATSYHRFKKVNQRLFTLPRPTVAAINGHAYAGGLITAFCCDFRVAANTPIRLGLNEVAIGLAMPAHFTEIIRYAVGTKLAAELNLLARTYSVEEASTKGIVDYVVPEDELIDKAVAIATEIPRDCLTAYSFSKRALQAPTVQRLDRDSEAIDSKFEETWCSADAQSATKRTYARLKSRTAR